MALEPEGRGMRRRDWPVWALMLESIGGLITGIGAVVVLVYAWRMIGLSDYWSMSLPTILGFGSATTLLGRTLMVAAKSVDPEKRSRRYRLWAELLLHVGGILIISVPLFVYGMLYFGMQVVDLDGQPGPTGEAWRLKWTALIAGAPFAIGVILVLSALIWGRRLPPPDIPAVFG